ncbi:MAG TPA: patatin-like phospholipase family protein [Pseudobdellovibrionaceae bacterium]|nr:patatin-like phospholipase family protein [Pseudobdellovibrionaceae bacterium]
MNYKNKKKIALVLSGGGIKAAAFHLGACLALQHKGFVFMGGPKGHVTHQENTDKTFYIKSYVGSSAGAFVASILSAGYSVESLINAFQIGIGGRDLLKKGDPEYLKPLSYRNIFSLNQSGLLNFLPNSFVNHSLITGGLEVLLKKGFKWNGLFSTKGLESYLRKDALIVNDFSNLDVDLFITATQLNHTRKVIFGNFKNANKTGTTKYINYASISQAVACSAALPVFFSPYGLKRPDGKEIHYYDGEIRDTLSTHVAVDHGADLVISSYSIQPYHYTEAIGSLHKFGLPVLLNQALYQVIEQKISKHIQDTENHKNLYNNVKKLLDSTTLDTGLKSKVLDEIVLKTHHRVGVDYLYIHPRPQDHQMFFVDHFSLNSKILEKIIRIGFKSALRSLREA